MKFIFTILNCTLHWVVSISQGCATLYVQKSSSAQKANVKPTKNLLLIPLLLQATVSKFTYSDCFYTNGIIRYALFCVYCLSPPMVFLRSIHIVANISTALLPMGK
jgi:hypothetical protein